MLKKPKSPIPIDQIDGMIRTIRGTRVMPDRDLAKIYGVPTKAFNQGCKTKSTAVSRGFYVSADLGRSQGTSGFKVTICDLETGRERQISAICLHRIRCVDGCQYPKQRAGCSDEHFCCPSLCENARGTSRHA